ncbi:MAG: TolC family protein, partial [Myxococcales bacterium]|nr:TolC family protein [Myxococcales bacterium]
WVAAANTSRARLDLVGTAGMVGLWAEDDLPGLQLPGRRPGLVAVGGVELELPIGSAAADAQRDRARLALEAADERLIAARQTLEATIASIYEEAESARERVPLATEAASVAERLAEAERGRLELGTATPADLLLVQQAARESALRRLRALVDAVTASHRLAHAAGVLLDRFSVQVPETPTRRSEAR